MTPKLVRLVVDVVVKKEKRVSPGAGIDTERAGS